MVRLRAGPPRLTGLWIRKSRVGVPRKDLPRWDDLQILAAQMATKPLLDDHPVGTELVIGPEADNPLRLDIPLFFSEMRFGALSEEAKVALARGAELAGTGICSGEGGMLPEEHQANSRYFYELASAQFGCREELLPLVPAGGRSPPCTARPTSGLRSASSSSSSTSSSAKERRTRRTRTRASRTASGIP